MDCSVSGDWYCPATNCILVLNPLYVCAEWIKWTGYTPRGVYGTMVLSAKQIYTTYIVQRARTRKFKVGIRYEQRSYPMITRSIMAMHETVNFGDRGSNPLG